MCQSIIRWRPHVFITEVEKQMLDADILIIGSNKCDHHCLLSSWSQAFGTNIKTSLNFICPFRFFLHLHWFWIRAERDILVTPENLNNFKQLRLDSVRIWCLALQVFITLGTASDELCSPEWSQLIAFVPCIPTNPASHPNLKPWV